jgi:hypothetical protein
MSVLAVALGVAAGLGVVHAASAPASGILNVTDYTTPGTRPFGTAFSSAGRSACAELLIARASVTRKDDTPSPDRSATMTGRLSAVPLSIPGSRLGLRWRSRPETCSADPTQTRHEDLVISGRRRCSVADTATTAHDASPQEAVIPRVRVSAWPASRRRTVPGGVRHTPHRFE